MVVCGLPSLYIFLLIDKCSVEHMFSLLNSQLNISVHLNLINKIHSTSVAQMINFQLLNVTI